MLGRSITNLEKPVVDNQLDSPPYEEPNVCQILTNFAVLHWGSGPPDAWTFNYRLAKLFVDSLNMWFMDTPSQYSEANPGVDVQPYKIAYTRWLCYCHVPSFCTSLSRYEPSYIFGKDYIKLIMGGFKTHLVGKATENADTDGQEVVEGLKQFLSLFQEELTKSDSEVLDPTARLMPSCVSSKQFEPLFLDNIFSIDLAMGPLSSMSAPSCSKSPATVSRSRRSRRTASTSSDQGPEPKRAKMDSVSALRRLGGMAAAYLRSPSVVQSDVDGDIKEEQLQKALDAINGRKSNQVFVSFIVVILCTFTGTGSDF